MNPRVVRSIRRGLRHGESGQAFAELSVSLVAFLAAFVGFLLIAMLGSDRITNLINARKEADNLSREGYFGNGNPVSIRRYDYGEDGIPYTADDIPLSGSAGNGSAFTEQLSDNTGLVSLQNPPSSLSSARDFAMLRESGDFFLNAASLAEGRESFSLSNRQNVEFLNAAQWLFGIKDVHMDERVYMPAHKSEQ